MNILTDNQKEYLRSMPAWQDKDMCSGEAIILRCKEVEEQYEFDVEVPLSEQREHITRLQEKLRNREHIREAFGNVRAGDSPFRDCEIEAIPGYGEPYNIILSIGLSVFLVLLGIAVLFASIAWFVT